MDGFHVFICIFCFQWNCKSHCGLLLSTAIKPETNFILLSIHTADFKKQQWKLYSKFWFLANVIVFFKKITLFNKVDTIIHRLSSTCCNSGRLHRNIFHRQWNKDLHVTTLLCSNNSVWVSTKTFSPDGLCYFMCF